MLPHRSGLPRMSSRFLARLERNHGAVSGLKRGFGTLGQESNLARMAGHGPLYRVHCWPHRRPVLYSLPRPPGIFPPAPPEFTGWSIFSLCSILRRIRELFLTPAHHQADPDQAALSTPILTDFSGDRLRELNWRFTLCKAHSRPSNNAKRLLLCCCTVTEHL
jgi:hypothetical protein